MFFKSLNTAPTFDDVVFEQRNRTYGAYELRSHYADRMTRALIMTTGLLVAPIVLYVLLHRYTIPQSSGIGIITLPDTITRVHLLPKILSGGAVVHKVIDTKNYKIARTHDDPTPDPTTTPAAIPSATEGNNIKFNTGTGTELNLPNIAPEGNASGGAGTATKTLAPVDFVDSMPQFPGGDESLMKYLKNSIQYTPVDRDNGIQGDLYVQFVVMTDGTVEGIKIVKSVGGTFDGQAIRAINNMPRWKPGSNGKYRVPVRMTLPVKCQLDR